MSAQPMLQRLREKFAGEHRYRLLPFLTLPIFALAALLTWDGWRQSQAAVIGSQLRLYATAGASQAAARIAELQNALDTALTRSDVQRAFKTNDHEGVLALLRKALPQASDVRIEPLALDAVYADGLPGFGFGRLALIESVLATGGTRSLVLKVEGQAQLGVAAPIRNEGRVLGVVVATFPLEQLAQVIAGNLPPGGYMALRQGQFEFAALGDASLAQLAEAGAQPVPGSNLRVVATAPETNIGLLPPGQSWPIAGLLAIVGIGALLLMARRRHVPAAPVAAEPTLGEVAASSSTDKPTAKPRAEVKAAPSLALDRSIFRAYDIRGVLGSTLDAGIARLIGRAVGALMHERGLGNIVVGRDGRTSGPDLVNGLIAGLRSAGCDVIDIGQVPTPVAYFGAFHLGTGSCISVTGSHNPPEYNGFKIVVGGETLSGDAITGLYTRIAENQLYDAPSMGRVDRRDISADYVERISNDIQVEQRLKVVVDCGNGVAGALAPLVLESIGCEAIPLYCDVDGSFPNHHPDPSDPANLTDLIGMVQRMDADLGIALDGDGDRLGVVTRDGEIIYPDRLLMLFAEDVLMRNPGACIIYDVKCTGRLAGHVLRHGGSPVMWRTGHSLIKAKMKETEAELAGEMSGHFFFRERWYGFDDGIYAAARLLEILAARGEPADAVFAEIPKDVSTPELKVPMAEGEHYDFIQRFVDKARFEGARINTIDGLRADWADGWGLIRASNTTPVLVLRFEANDDEALARIQTAFRTQMLTLKPGLSLPF